MRGRHGSGPPSGGSDEGVFSSSSLLFSGAQAFLPACFCPSPRPLQGERVRVRGASHRKTPSPLILSPLREERSEAAGRQECLPHHSRQARMPALQQEKREAGLRRRPRCTGFASPVARARRTANGDLKLESRKLESALQEKTRDRRPLLSGCRLSSFQFQLLRARKPGPTATPESRGNTRPP